MGRYGHDRDDDYRPSNEAEPVVDLKANLELRQQTKIRPAATLKTKTERRSTLPKYDNPPSGADIKNAIKRLIVDDMSITLNELVMKLGKDGIQVSRVTISNIRTEFRETIKFFLMANIDPRRLQISNRANGAAQIDKKRRQPNIPG